MRWWSGQGWLAAAVSFDVSQMGEAVAGGRRALRGERVVLYIN